MGIRGAALTASAAVAASTGVTVANRLGEVSAIIAALLGAIACVLWNRHHALAPRVLVILGTLASLGIGLFFRPDMPFLDSEHVLAWALGVALADETVRRGLARRPRRGRAFA